MDVITYDNSQSNPSQKIAEWMDNDRRFNLNAEDLGWNAWSPDLEEDIGFTSFAGSSLYKRVNIERFAEVYYDNASWTRLNLNNDAYRDILVISTLLQGANVLVNEHTMYAFCGWKNNTTSGGSDVYLDDTNNPNSNAAIGYGWNLRVNDVQATIAAFAQVGISLSGQQIITVTLIWFNQSPRRILELKSAGAEQACHRELKPSLRAY